MFDLLRSKALFGDSLREIQALQNSISRFGLLTPVIAIRRAGRLIVVDGRKRLTALKRMAFDGKLPRSLSQVPFLLINDLSQADRRAPRLVANADLFALVQRRWKNGQDLDALATDLNVSRQCVRDILLLDRLAPSVRNAFFDRTIDFAQARAFAAVPDQAEQLRRFRHLGPTALPDQILQWDEAARQRSRIAA
ncbi:ParB/RepB/Spo0J family partition protein [uncultured Algimonas sp.]|uniref:ParB/RepB/Spo0J family partition protein n=1 Tax=uncultured Algimonas sp. TaxID=1547920 RepID=UPI002612C739|nr:ParB/RepB/Spo0J family partition protein [uncultured Algimonas sp.]